MKRLMLMRHAKASSDGPTDLERPLNDPGVAAASLMGELLAVRQMVPQRLVSSPAKRALQTAALFSESTKLGVEIVPEMRIYDADPQTLLDIAAEFPNGLETVMMVGHNPGFEGFVALLTGTTRSMRTGAVAVIDLKTEAWHQIAEGSGKLVEMLEP